MHLCSYVPILAAISQDHMVKTEVKDKQRNFDCNAQVEELYKRRKILDLRTPMIATFNRITNCLQPSLEQILWTPIRKPKCTYITQSTGQDFRNIFTSHQSINLNHLPTANCLEEQSTVGESFRGHGQNVLQSIPISVPNIGPCGSAPYV